MGALDRRKHDVDVIERVLSGVRDRLQEDRSPTHIIDVGPRSAAEHSLLELTIGLGDDDGPPRGQDG